MKPEEQTLVLIVDDDPDMLMQLEMQVKNMGFQVETAGNQKEAEAFLENRKPDLAILDLIMEKEDSGFILSYKLKKKYSDVPVIIVSSVTAKTGIFFELGASNEKSWIKADAFLQKGIRPDQLHREICKLLKN